MAIVGINGIEGCEGRSVAEEFKRFHFYRVSWRYYRSGIIKQMRQIMNVPLVTRKSDFLAQGTHHF